MKLEKTFYTDSMKNYMILKGPADGKNPGYQYRMLSANTIGRMLSCSVRFIDNTCLFYYDITSMQSLAVLYACRGMDQGAVRELLYGVLGAQQKLAAFLLDARRVIFDPECIFYDFEKKEYLFAYYPEDLEGNDCSVLYTFLADHADPMDEPAVRMAYELTDIAMAQDGFLLTESYLEGLILRAAGQEEVKSGGSKEDTAEPEDAGSDYDFFYVQTEPPDTAAESHDAYRIQEVSRPEKEGIKSFGGPSAIAGAGIFTAGMILFVLRLALKTEGQADSLIRSAVVSLMMTSVILFLYSLSRCFKEDTSAMMREEAHAAGEAREQAMKDRRKELMIEFGTGAEGPPVITVGEEKGEVKAQESPRTAAGARKYRLYGLGGARRYHIHLDDLPCTVGSLSQFADVVLDDQSISPLHVRFLQDGEDVSLMDLNSMFGTYLNGERAEPGIRLKLEPFDEIRIGRLEFSYR